MGIMLNNFLSSLSMGVKEVFQKIGWIINYFIALWNPGKILNLVKQVGSSSVSEKVKTIKDIPGPRSFKFFGTRLTSNSKTDLIKHCEDNVAKYGPLVREEWYWNYPVIVIYDPEDVEKVLKLTGTIRPGLEIMNMYKDLCKNRKYSGGIANSNGEEWVSLKSALKGIQSPQYLQTIIPAGNNVAEDFVNLIRKSGPVFEDFSVLISRAVIENSFQYCLGKRIGILQSEPVHPVGKVRIFEENLAVYWKALNDSVKGYPWWKHFNTKVWKDFVRSDAIIYKFITELINDATKTEQLNGVSSMIMNAQLLNEEQRFYALFELATATQSTTLAMIFVSYSIAKYDAIQEELYEELRKVLPEKDTAIEAKHIQEMPYLHACVMEAFRFLPPTPNLIRINEQDLELKGYHIPAYTLLHCQTWYSCLQEKCFYRAKEYLPERWLPPPNSEEGVRFLPHQRSMVTHFGMGKRSCPARRFALQEHIITLAKVFRNFRLEFTEDLQYSYEFLQAPKLPVKVIVHERQE